MKGFEITPEQCAAIVGALVADELGWRFGRHMDYLTVGSLAPATQFAAGGLRLDAEERAACARRATSFFGQPTEILAPGGDASALTDVAAWAEALHAATRRRLVEFAFTPAGRDSAREACRHAADAIFGEAAQASKLLYGRRRLISLVAPHSLMGFVLTILAPNLQRIPMLDARGVAPDDLNAELAFGDAVVATPSLWRYLLRQGVAAPDNAMGLFFGEAMEPELTIELRKAGFVAQRELYGSTETGLIGWRDTVGAPFMLFDHLARDGDALSRRLPAGAAEAVAPMDVLEWEGERQFRLAGRRDGAVQVGAVNVFPLRIADAIGGHRHVAGCRIRVGRHEGGFNRLIAHIVLADARTPSETVARSIDSWCRAHLGPHERPRIYHFEDGLDALEALD